MLQGFQKHSDMRQGFFLNLTCDMGIHKQQRHVTVGFTKINMGHGGHLSRAPRVGGVGGGGAKWVSLRCTGVCVICPTGPAVMQQRTCPHTSLIEGGKLTVRITFCLSEKTL